MGEDLKKANEEFKKLLAEAKAKDKNKCITKEVEFLLYLFYLNRFNSGSGMTQLVA